MEMESYAIPDDNSIKFYSRIMPTTEPELVMDAI